MGAHRRLSALRKTDRTRLLSALFNDNATPLRGDYALSACFGALRSTRVDSNDAPLK
jgi:hypothetical protein